MPCHCSRRSLFAPLSELTAEKWQFFVGKQAHGQINLVQAAIPFIKEKGSFTLVSAFLTTNRSSPALRRQPSQARWKVLFAQRQLNFKGAAYQCGESTILKESEAQFGPFFPA